MNSPRAAFTKRTRILIGYTLRERCHVWDSTLLPSANESQSGAALMVFARTYYNGFIRPIGWSWPDGPRRLHICTPICTLSYAHPAYQHYWNHSTSKILFSFSFYFIFIISKNSCSITVTVLKNIKIFYLMTIIILLKFYELAVIINNLKPIAV